MKRIRNHLAAVLAVCLLALPLLTCSVRAYENMTAGDACLELIKRYEGFSAQKYEKNGYWYVGYGTKIDKDAYPDGVTEEEAEALIRGELESVEKSLNSFFSQNHLVPTQGQFDALADFSYIHGAGWLNGNSALLRIVRGDSAASRRETAQAFGVWSHSGGKVLSSLANRHLEEAALYLDGDLSRADEFVFLSVEKRADVICSTDFAVYERGGVYDAFPAMFLLGHTLTGALDENGNVIRIGDTVTGSHLTTPIWEENDYAGSYDDVRNGAWFYDYVMELSDGGVVNGRGSGVFDPDASVTVGEALKLILLAAGEEEQVPVGEHWASGYAEFARANDYLPGELLNAPDTPIKRVDVARLAAKAIGFGQSYADSPFVDTKNGYAVALAGIGVLNGITEKGESHFYPDKLLTRAEVSAIVWRLRNQVALGATQTLSYASRYYDTLPDVALCDYSPDGFSGSGAAMTYSESGVRVLRGVDVSSFQKEVDWAKVAASGIDFAILRAGYRGYTTGALMTDDYFEANFLGASGAGLTVGVYVYSQAVNVDEALEEAEFVLAALDGKAVNGPVVFDWESTGKANARTNDISASTVCDCAVAFCERVKAAGYEPMVYMNRYDAYRKYDLTRMTDYPIWYAGEYNGAYPRFIYDYSIWQYTDKGKVDGISGNVDMDLWFFS